MSRSFKNPISNTKTVRITNACVGDTGMSKWKKDYNRTMRRTNKHKVNKIDVEDTDNIPEFVNDPEKISIGDPWLSPHDGYHRAYILSYKDTMK